MEDKQGLTLLELVVVMLIVGILVAIAVPIYNNDMVNSKIQGVEHNLMAIGAAEQKYNEDHGNYCINDATNCGNSQANLNANLSLSMAVVNDGFNYSCASSGTSFLCSASNSSYPTSAGTTVTVDASGTLTCSSGACP